MLMKILFQVMQYDLVFGSNIQVGFLEIPL